MKKIVIGLCGKKGAGKEKFTSILRDVICETKIRPSRTVHSTSGVLEKICRAANILPSRPNLQKLPIVLKEAFPGWTLAKLIQSYIEEDQSQISVVDALRLPEDLLMIRSFSYSLVVYIEARDELRFERIKKRNQKPGEAELTWEKFIEEEKAQTESYIEQLAASADFKIDNNGEMEDLAPQVAKFVTDHFLLMWQKMHAAS